MAHVRVLGPVHADVVSVGIFLKNPRKFAELRPMQNWVAVSFALNRQATHRTITRKVISYGSKFWHTANVATPDDVDEALRDLIHRGLQRRRTYMTIRTYVLDLNVRATMIR